MVVVLMVALTVAGNRQPGKKEGKAQFQRSLISSHVCQQDFIFICVFIHVYVYIGQRSALSAIL